MRTQRHDFSSVQPHVVAPGESLPSIAANYGTTVDQIHAATTVSHDLDAQRALQQSNRLLLEPGMVIYVPGR